MIEQNKHETSLFTLIKNLQIKYKEIKSNINIHIMIAYTYSTQTQSMHVKANHAILLYYKPSS